MQFSSTESPCLIVRCVTSHSKDVAGPEIMRKYDRTGAVRRGYGTSLNMRCAAVRQIEKALVSKRFETSDSGYGVGGFAD